MFIVRDNFDSVHLVPVWCVFFIDFSYQADAHSCWTVFILFLLPIFSTLFFSVCIYNLVIHSQQHSAHNHHLSSCSFFMSYDLIHKEPQVVLHSVYLSIDVSLYSIWSKKRNSVLQRLLLSFIQYLSLVLDFKYYCC